MLQHFEECHADDRHASDEDEDLFEFETMEECSDASDSYETPLTFTDIYFKSSSHSSAQAIALSDIYIDPSSPLGKKRLAEAAKFNEDTMMMDVELPTPCTTPRPTDLTRSNSIVSSESQSPLVDEKDDRPYKCKVTGCTKAYKNPGGLKYHMQHGHCEDTGDPEMNNIIHKPYECAVPGCGRRYKNLNGLKVRASPQILTL